MAGKWLVIGLMLVALPRSGAAQEVPGAERIEIGSAIFGGGLIFVPSADASNGTSHSYVLSAAVTTNVNKWIGLEGDVGVAMSRRRAHEFFGVSPKNATPNMLLYSGNVIYNPLKSNRPIVPYVSAGLGALTTFSGEESTDFGFGPDRTFLTGSLGGGVRWFPIRHSGFRADYRFMAVNNADAASAGRRVVRSAHRVFGALVLTF